MKDDFDEWYEQRGWGGYWDARLTWIAAQHAERERIKQILEDAGTYCSWDKIMEAIDQ